MTLKTNLQHEIAQNGVMRLDAYIERCLWDQDHGYYRREEVFGEKGDFVTSPEISQIFGEVIGFWAIDAWIEMGSPLRFTLLELGSGRGLLMRDLLRAVKAQPSFVDAMDLCILEKSPARRAEQTDTIDHPIRFLDDLTLSPHPAIILSNEFFDALPIRQFRNEGGGWLEAFVDENIQKIWQPCPRPPAEIAGFLDSAGVIEINQTAISIHKAMGDHIATYGGQVMTIDYGDWDGVGDTLQALQAHKKVDVFAEGGEADLTSHIRFRDLAEAGRLDCRFMSQSEFLNAYGGKTRRDQIAMTNPKLADEIKAGYARLVDDDQMGKLFKVLIQKGATKEGKE